MGWVVQTLVKILLKAICGLFGNLATDFVTKFGLNIGSKFPVIGGPDISLNDVLSTYYAYGRSGSDFASAFDIMFPMFYLRKVFIIMAITIATALFAKELVLAMASPLSGGQRQHPITSTSKFIVSIVAIILSYRLFIVLEYVMNQFYIKIGTLSLNLMHDIDSMPTGKLTDVFTDDIASKVTNATTTVFDFASFVNPTAAVTIGIGELILNLIVVYLIFVNFIKLLLEILERYIVVGVLFYTAPLAFSTIPSNDTRDIFKSWFRMSVSEMLLVVTNSIFICIFIGSLGHMNNIFVNAPQSFIESVSTAGQLSWIVYMMLLLAWLLFAQRLDSYLNSLGLSTAQTGGSLGAAVIAGAAAVAGATAGFGGKVLSSAPLKASRMAGLKPKDSWSALGKTAKDVASSKTQQAKTALQGGAGAHDKGTSASQAADNRLRGVNEGNSMKNKLQQSGYSREAASMGRAAIGNTIEGAEGRNLAEAIATQANDRGLQNTIRNAQSVSVGPQKDGSLGMNIKDKNGNDLNVAIGGNMANKTPVGEVGGVKLGATGSVGAMQNLVGEKQLRNDMAVASLTSPTLAAGHIVEGGQQIASMKNMATGQTYMVAPAGTTVGNNQNAEPLGNGGLMGVPVSGAQFTSLARGESMLQYKQGFVGQLDSMGYSELSRQVSGSEMPFQLTPTNTSAIASGMPFGVAQMLQNANNTMDPANLSIKCDYGGAGGSALLEFNPDNASDGSVMKTDYGNIALSVAEYGEGVMSDIRATTNFNALQSKGQDFIDMLNEEYQDDLSVWGNRNIPNVEHDERFDENAMPIVSGQTGDLAGYITSSTLASGLPGEWYSLNNGMSIQMFSDYWKYINAIKEYLYSD